MAPPLGMGCGLGDSAGPPVERGHAEPEVATQVGCSECIAIDLSGERSIVTNLLTHERGSLEGHWHIAHDDEGQFAELYAPGGLAGEGRTLDVDSLGWRKSVFRKESGELLVVQRCGNDLTKVALDDLATEQRQATVTLTTGVSAASFEIATFVFCRPRLAKQRCFWSLADLYRFLALKSFAGQPSKWVHNSLASWNRLFEGIAGDGFVVFSTYINDSCENRHSIAWVARCLPQTSVATAGMLALLARWAFCSSQRGGLTKKENRAAAELLLGSLLSWVDSVDGDLLLLVEVAATWRCRWPRPEPIPDGHSYVQLRCSGGKVSLEPLLSSGRPGGAQQRVAASWQKALSEHLDLRLGCVGLLALLEAAAKSCKLAPLFGQLAVGLSMQLENRLLASSKRAEAVGRLRFQWLDAKDSRISFNELDRRLAQYVQASQKVSQKHHRHAERQSEHPWAAGADAVHDPSEQHLFGDSADGAPPAYPPTRRLRARLDPVQALVEEFSGPLNWARALWCIICSLHGEKIYTP